MISSQKGKIGIIGAGLIGRAWSIVFARAGHAVALHDADPDAMGEALAAMEAGVGAPEAEGLVCEPVERVLARVSPAASVAEAVTGAAYVQENIAETPEAKSSISMRRAASRTMSADMARRIAAWPRSKPTRGAGPRRWSRPSRRSAAPRGPPASWAHARRGATGRLAALMAHKRAQDKKRN